MRLIVKPHYFDVHSLSRILRHRKNILLLTDDELNKQGLDFYDILKGSELLITDYSSVYIDYLVTTKPIIFFVPDLEDYLEKNTVCLEPFEEWTPGPKVKTVEEMSSNSFKALKGIAMGYQKKNRLVSAGIFCCRSFSRIP